MSPRFPQRWQCSFLKRQFLGSWFFLPHRQQGSNSCLGRVSLPTELIEASAFAPFHDLADLSAVSLASASSKALLRVKSFSWSSCRWVASLLSPQTKRSRIVSSKLSSGNLQRAAIRLNSAAYSATHHSIECSMLLVMGSQYQASPLHAFAIYHITPIVHLSSSATNYNTWKRTIFSKTSTKKTVGVSL